jgi:uncharacterized protein YjaZ
MLNSRYIDTASLKNLQLNNGCGGDEEGDVEFGSDITVCINTLSPELNPICYLLALLAHDFHHVNRIRVKSLTLRLQTSYIYGAPILDVSRSHTTTQHSR